MMAESLNWPSVEDFIKKKSTKTAESKFPKPDPSNLNKAQKPVISKDNLWGKNVYLSDYKQESTKARRIAPIAINQYAY